MASETIFVTVFGILAISAIAFAAHRLFGFMNSSDALLKAWAGSVKTEKDLVFRVRSFRNEIIRQGVEPCDLLPQLLKSSQKHLDSLDERHIDVDKMLAVRQAREEVISTFETICMKASITDESEGCLAYLRKSILAQAARVEEAKKVLGDAIDVFQKNRQRFPASLLYAN